MGYGRWDSAQVGYKIYNFLPACLPMTEPFYQRLLIQFTP